MAKRIIFITSKDDWIQRNLADLKIYLLNRKYPEHIIDKGIFNASLQGPVPLPKREKVIPLITPYLSNHDNSNIKNAAHDLISNSRNQRLRKAFKDTKLIQCYSQPRNMSGLLTNSKFITESTGIQQDDAGIFHCTDSRCKICKMYLQKCKSFVTSNGETWEVKCHASCNSKNTLYYLVCEFCKWESYTGQTVDFRLRTNNHITGCRYGNGTDDFDNHVFKCANERNLPLVEPFFRAYIYMVLKDHNMLLNMERRLHLKCFDTINNPNI